jgi:hypothetical protein
MNNLDSISLLLNSTWWHKEVLHQMMLDIIFDNTDLSEVLGGQGWKQIQNTRNEVGDGKFDLQIPCDGRNINIEIKLNSLLSDGQILRQKQACAPNDQMWYFLLGTAIHFRNDELTQHKRVTKVFDDNVRAKVFNLDEICDALSSCSLKNNADSKVKGLIQTYQSKLLDFQDRVYHGYENWEYYEWASFFSKIERRGWQIFKSMKSGNFWAAGWNWIEMNNNISVAIELEQDRGMFFKIQVKDKDKSVRTSLRNAWHLHLMMAGGDSVWKPQNFGNGGWMTAAVFMDKSELQKLANHDLQEFDKRCDLAEQIIELALQEFKSNPLLASI